MGTYVDDLALLAGVMRTRRGILESDAAQEFTRNVEPIIPTMLRLARRLGRENAEDIVQDALARAWVKRADFDPRRGTFGAWLMAITADRAYKTWRRSFRRNRPTRGHAESQSTPDEFIDLEQSIRGLPARQRLAVDCYYFAGLSVAETASVMRCSEGTVKSTLSAARSVLREVLR